MKDVRSIVIEGHRVASGRSRDDLRFPGGTIQMQKPFFKERGLDLDLYFGHDYVSGTLNLSIAPMTFEIVSPEHVFKSVRWTGVLPPENFFLSEATLEYKQQKYKALIYIPDPSTKADHFKPMSVVEVISQTIPRINYGDEVVLLYNPKAIRIA